ncbi:reverse transcriptase-like protein [Elysia marginata]|uniref:Reverse transcriptase-like protein n=1 Tax=Elysia marginata TaxID=1093978 RepID=A0AAV4EL87_9GAST|nr:reverse transcriptase-like protein [Elysia marginata]
MSNFIFLGDINFHYDCDNSTEANKLKATLLELDLIQLIETATHDKGHILDWVVTPLNFKYIKSSTVTNLCISDHYFITCLLDLDKPKRIKNTVQSRRLKNIDFKLFEQDISTSLQKCPSPNIQDFKNILSRTLDEHAPLTKRTIPHRRYSPWFDDNIQAAKQERRSAERAWLKSGLQIHRQIFIAARKKVNNEVKNAKKRFYLAKFSTTKTYKKLFSLTDQLLGKTKHKLNGDKELCNKFSTFFDSKITKIREEL